MPQDFQKIKGVKERSHRIENEAKKQNEYQVIMFSGFTSSLLCRLLLNFMILGCETQVNVLYRPGEETNKVPDWNQEATRGQHDHDKRSGRL